MPARDAARIVAVGKIMQKYDVRKALTFHINICKEARGGIGRALLVGGVEVRAPSV